MRKAIAWGIIVAFAASILGLLALSAGWLNAIVGLACVVVVAITLDWAMREVAA
jgi:hypothetical protein